MKATLSCIALALVLVGSGLAAEQATPDPQVSALRAQVRTLKTQNARLKTRIVALKGTVSLLKSERDEAAAEALRLRGLIVDDVHGLAEAWRTDGNPKTDVTYYQSDNYWSYSFTWCGFC